MKRYKQLTVSVDPTHYSFNELCELVAENCDFFEEPPDFFESSSKVFIDFSEFCSTALVGDTTSIFRSDDTNETNSLGFQIPEDPGQVDSSSDDEPLSSYEVAKGTDEEEEVKWYDDVEPPLDEKPLPVHEDEEVRWSCYDDSPCSSTARLFGLDESTALLGGVKKYAPTNRRRGPNRFGYKVPIPRPPRSSPFPLHMTIPLTFQKTFLLTTAAERFSPNNIYDVDPLFGSTTMIGYTAAASIYNYYQAVSFDVRSHFVSEDNYTSFVYAVVLNTDPSTTTTQYPFYALSNWGKKAAISSYSKTVTFRQRWTLNQLIGKPVLQSDNYGAAVGYSPANIVWVGFAAIPNNSGTLTTGVSVHVEIRSMVRFYEPKNLIQ